MKKSVSLVLALLMLLACLVTPIAAAEGDGTEPVKDFVITPDATQGVSFGTNAAKDVFTKSATAPDGTKAFKLTTNTEKTANDHYYVGCIGLSGLSLDIADYDYIRYEYYVESLGGAEKDGNYKKQAPSITVKVGSTSLACSQSSDQKVTLGSIPFSCWGTIETPIVEESKETAVSGTITNAWLNTMGYVNSEWNCGAVLYIKSITFSKNSDMTAPDAVYTSEHMRALALTCDSNVKEGSGQGRATIDTAATYNGLSVIKLAANPKANTTNYYGIFDVNATCVPVGVYSYLKVSFCIVPKNSTALATSTKTPTIVWYDNGKGGKWNSITSSAGNVTTFDQKWNTAVFDISGVTNYAQIELGLIGDWNQTECDFYIQSITFSQNANTADDYIKAVGAQNRTDDTAGVRFVSVIKDIDLTQYSTVGLKITTAYDSKNGAWDHASNVVYTTLKGGDETYTPGQLLAGGAYFSAVTMTGIPADAAVTFTVVPYLVKTTGEVICGVPATVTVGNGQVA